VLTQCPDRLIRGGRCCCAWQGCVVETAASATTGPSTTGDFTTVNQSNQSINSLIHQSVNKRECFRVAQLATASAESFKLWKKQISKHARKVYWHWQGSLQTSEDVFVRITGFKNHVPYK